MWTSETCRGWCELSLKGNFFLCTLKAFFQFYTLGGVSFDKKCPKLSFAQSCACLHWHYLVVTKYIFTCVVTQLSPVLRLAINSSHLTEKLVWVMSWRRRWVGALAVTVNFVVNSGVISEICSRMVLVLFQENAMQQNLISTHSALWKSNLNPL